MGALLCLLATACSSGTRTPQPDTSEDGGSPDNIDGGPIGSGRSATKTVGPSGAVMVLEGSAGTTTLTIPSGALAADTAITITETTDAPPTGYSTYSPVYRFAPEGLAFVKPITVALPFAGDVRLATLFWSRPAATGYERTGGLASNGVVTGRVEHFSTGFIADGVQYTDPPDRSCAVSRIVKGQTLGALSSLGLVFTVDDCQGRPITGLTCATYPSACDFVLSEDGRSLSSEAAATILPTQGLTSFVALLIDMSSSTGRALPQVIAAAKAFASRLQAGGNPLGVQMGVYAFAGEKDVATIQKPTLDLDTLLARIDSLSSYSPMDGASTNLYGAAIGALGLVGAERRAFEQRTGGGLTAGHLVLFTDGRDTAALATLDDVSLCTDPAKRAAAPTECQLGSVPSLSVFEQGGSCRYASCSDGSCCSAGQLCQYSAHHHKNVCIPSQGAQLCNNGASVCPADASCSSPASCCCTTDACTQAIVTQRCGDVSTEVWAVGLRSTDYVEAALTAIAAAGVFHSEDLSTLERDFEALANRIAGQATRTYLLGYCSPTRAGQHSVTVAVASATNDSSTGYAFTGRTGGSACTAAYLGALRGPADAPYECGAFGSGVCDDRVAKCVGARCVSFCAGKCGGEVIMNPNGYEQTCFDVPESTLCGGVCVDTTKDRANCGTCGNGCATGAACTASTCKCPGTQAACGGVCVADLTTNANHCGTCGNECAIGGSCSDSVCSCPGTQSPCGGTCVDTGRDADNCGACGNECSAVAVGAVCSTVLGTATCKCPGSQTLCNGICVDTASDANNCGACGNKCSAFATNAVCSIAGPVDPPTCKCAGPVTPDGLGAQTLCNGSCVDTTSDADNCGTCSNRCSALGPTAICSSSRCKCIGSQTLCNASCVDMATDALNCGACGHSCQGGTCASGVCAPVVLASGQGSPQGIAVDATSVYWTNASGNTVMKLPLAGGTPVTLASSQSSPQNIAVDASSIYWSNRGNGTVMKAPLAGGTPVILSSNLGTPKAIVVDSSSVYWITCYGQNCTVMKVPLAGGIPVALASGQLDAAEIAVDASSVYWTTAGTGPSVMRVPREGGTAVVLASGSGVYSPYGIAVDATSVYWANGGASVSGPSIVKVPLAGGTRVTLASGQRLPWGIAVDASGVYWTTYSGNTVMNVPLIGGTPLVLASGQGTPWGIAVDARTVYWTNKGNGTIMKLAK